jgi:MFS family permease
MHTPLSGNTAFTRLWTAETATVLAYQMVAVAIGWQVYDLTGRALDLGLVGLAQFGAQLLFSLPAGHMADRYDRRRIVLACQLLQTSIATVLALGSHGGWISGPTVYLAAFCLGTATTLQSPSLRSMLPGLVGQEALPRAIAWSATMKKAATILGPALGGALYYAGADFVYATSAVCYVAAGFTIISLRRPPARNRHEPVTMRFMLGGFGYIRRHKVVLGAISLDLFATLLGGVTALLPIYARDILHTGPEGLGLLRAAPAAGAVVASIYLARSPLTRGIGRILFGSVAVFGVATLVFGVSAHLPLSLAALLVLGSADMVSQVIRASLVQLETPDEMRGRVTAVNALFTGTSNQLGQFEAGVMATLLGTVPAVIFGGCGTLLVVVTWMYFFPSILHRQTLGQPEPAAATDERAEQGATAESARAGSS